MLSLAAADSEGLLQLLLAVVLGAIACIGLGAAALVVRAILPGAAASADASLARLSTWRLFVSGILPIVGAALLARGVDLVGNDVVSGIFLLIIVLPLTLAWIAGLLAGLPYLGGKALRQGSEASPLARAALGGLVAGLAMVSWVLPPLGLVLTLLLTGWFLGIGLGSLIHRRPRTEEQV